MAVSRNLDGSQLGELQQAFGLLQAGKTEEALTVACHLSEKAAWSADVQQLLGMCLSATGRDEAAVAAFERALAIAPGYPVILSNYALAMRRSGRTWAAVGLARRASEIAPSPKTWLDLGVAAQAAGDHALARWASAQLLRLQPDSASALLVAGNAARAQEDLAAAEQAYQRIMQREPQHRQALLGFGDVQRRAGRPEWAVALYEQARKQGDATSALADALVGALVDSGRADEALQLAKAEVLRAPDYVPGWTTLANLAWEYAEQAEGEDCLRQFELATTTRKDNPALRLAYARFLLSTGRAEEALVHLQALRAAHETPTQLLVEAQAHDALGQLGQAAALHARLQRAGWGDEPVFLNARARHLLRAGDGRGAAAAAQAATRINPGNQEAWAWLATAWRLLGDERENWLCDYERLVGLVDVEPPPQFADAQAFLHALARVLDAMHKARREPMQQSLRGGSQTPGRLFGRPEPLLEATRQSLQRAIESWLATLPKDAVHPFLSRNQGGVRIGGSWSVKLWSSGKHVNHIHAEGWMSSAFYVSLPPSLHPGSQAGAIQFGQPPVELGLELAPRRMVAPRTGMLALFPSYMWHGTIPFQDQAPRMTIAFDMTPLGASA